jgi:MFS family permease
MFASNITKVVIVNFCQRFHLYIHAYALLLTGRGLTLVQISLIESIVVGTIFLMEIPTGILADRVGRKWSIVLATLLMMSAEFLFIFAQNYAWYIIIALLTGTGFAFSSGAVEAIVYDSLPEDNRDDAMKKAMGRVNSMGQIAFFISPIIGGFFIRDARPEYFIPAIALTVFALFIGLIVSLTLREPSTEWSADKQNPIELFRGGISLLVNNSRLRRLALIVIFTSPFTGTLVTTLAAPHLVQNDVSPFMIGVVLSVGSLLAAITQRYVYKLEAWLGQRMAIALLILIPGVMYWVLALVAGPALTVFTVLLMYGINDMKAPLFSAYQNALIDSHNRATVLSLINMFVSLFIAIFAPIYASLAQQSLELAFVAMGGVIVLAGILLRVHNLPVEEDTALNPNL